MGIFHNRPGMSAAAVDSPPAPDLNPNMMGGSFDRTMRDIIARSRGEITREEAIGYTAVARCVALLANTVSGLPIQVWSRPGSRSSSADWAYPLHETESGFYTLLGFDSMVDDIQTWHQALNTAVATMLLTGNAYMHIERGLNRVTHLVPLDPDQMRLVQTGRVGGESFRMRYQYRYTAAGRDDLIMPEDILHFRMPQLHTSGATLTYAGGGSDDGRMYGTSPLQSLTSIVRIGKASEKFIGDYFTSSLGETVAIIWNGEMKEEQAKNIKKYFKDRAEGSEARAPVVLGGGSDIKKVQTDAASTELVDMRKQNVTDVCRAFGVPSLLLDEREVSTFGTGIAEIMRAFWRMSVQPIACAIESQLSAKLGNGQVTFRFDPAQITRESPKDELEMDLKLIGSNNGPGGISLEEFRRKRNMRPLNRDETWFIPAAFQRAAAAEGQPGPSA